MTVLEFCIILARVGHHHEKKRPNSLWAVVSGSLMLILFPSSSQRPISVKIKRLDQTHQFSDPGSLIYYTVHFPPRFSPGIPCQQNGHTVIQPLWHSLLLLLKLPVPLICKNSSFCLCNNWFQPSLEPDKGNCYIPMFLFLHGRQCFFDIRSWIIMSLFIFLGYFCEKSHTFPHNFQYFYQ